MKDLTTGGAGKLIFQFATPMLLGNIFQQFYNITDSIIIGNYLGKDALAAVGASFPLIFLLISLIIGVASGFTIVISQYFGAKDMVLVKRSIDTLYVFLFFASLLVSVIGIAFSGPVFRLIKLDPQVVPMAKEYFNIYIGGVIFAFGFNGISAILRGLGDSKTPLYFLIISTIANVFLDLLFVVVFHWGISGAAIATVISQAGAFITAVLYLNRTHEVVKLTTIRIAFDRYIFRQSMRIGLPSGFQQTFVSLGFLALFRIVNNFGTSATAAFTVAMRIDGFASLPAMNFAAALATFVGQNIGANKPERVKKGFYTTLWMTTLISVVVSIVVILFRRPLIGLFSQEAEVIAIGASYLLIVSLFYPLFSAMFTVNGVMRGAGDTLIPMFITLFSLWIVRIPISYVLSLKYGVNGIWWGIPVAWFFGMSLTYIYYLSNRWKTKSVIRHFPRSE